ncbi:MAG TPA: hypothetical protein VFG20_23360 [Planctomycetaceae bacterium]|nr:hypothetical protein [Planctomycetaceae bacterium]
MLLAYFDPGSASLLMQALVGGGAGLVVFGRYLWATCLGRKGEGVVGREGAWTPSVDRSPAVQPTLAEALSGEFRFNIT